jgi:assimilatory nitrate reductase catalytic subunit
MTDMTDTLREVKSACPYCGTGCGVIMQALGERIVGVRGDPAHPANFGKLCPKGQTLHLTATEHVIARSRLLYPQLRTTRENARRRVGWDEALDHSADQFAQVLRERGPETIAFYVSGQLLTEDYYVFNKLARALVGTNNVDSNSRLCMSSAVAGYKRTLGADAPPCSYQDLELADCVFVAGANPAVAHPVLFGRLLEARRQRGTRLIVADPRRTESAAAADLHLAVRPGADLWLLAAMLSVMVRDGLTNEAFVAAHTEGFDAAAIMARSVPLADVERITGVPAQDVERAARWFARAPATLSLYCQGLNQSSHGTDNNTALIHLHLATGQIGRAGAGPFSLTGQPNAMGGRETGTMATLLPGHRDPDDESDRAELARLWGVDALPARRGLTAVELFEACARGRIGALWIACTNPAQSLPDLARVHEALHRVPFVVVQDAFANTETAAFADVLLPAATFGEREGTSTNSERRITLSRAAVAPPGEARPDWHIAADFARRLAARTRPQVAAGFEFADARAVFDEYRQLTVGRDLDIGALDYALLERAGPQQWPLSALHADDAALGTARLYADGRFATPSGRARFVPFDLRGPAETTDVEFPLALTTVRLRDQWHGASRSGEVGILELPPAAVEVAPVTLAQLGIADDELVELATARGCVVLPARASETVAAGVACVPMHFGTRWLPASRGGINLLTAGALDPRSGQPELKYAAACVVRFDLPWHAALVGCVAPEAVGTLLETLGSLAQACAYASIVHFGRDPQRAGFAWLVAHTSPQAALIAAARSAFAIAADAPTLRDARAGRARTVSVVDGRLAAALLEGRTRVDIRAWSVYRRLIDQGIDCSRRSLRELFAPAGA